MIFRTRQIRIIGPTVADSELHFFTISNLNCTICVSLAQYIQLYIYTYNIHTCILSVHSLTKRSRSGLCWKPPDLRSVADIALNMSLCKKVNANKVNIGYGIVLIQLASCSFWCILSLF